MTTVYILQSEVDHRYYYGMTDQLMEDRLKEHNQGKSFHTKKFCPWIIIWFATFSSKEKALAFERYLKTPSGHAFSRKRLI
ncbi:MAG: hypothetical protein UT30_C0009G0039 [Candidatus Uhrbacteria bacterium GW2011_GWF2_39_13]|uniref:GIY-YIG domain-containing protein n=1 Tax=Candidatus Uhrbacteria bacterium GW2011_GWF2_39_13 TaxID=1618995 RepID=A0A0G0MJW6_9BACT|nr:MAG: hypothetical protein UT30_C0009G0039 [Candidatus Uhrbacteria bacterium GW2011_GWF2_39_13]HAU66224.1 excinuclease ABC subunit C [Candidatus Uhrbacteria bacterium]